MLWIKFQTLAVLYRRRTDVNTNELARHPSHPTKTDCSLTLETSYFQYSATQLLFRNLGKSIYVIHRLISEIQSRSLYFRYPSIVELSFASLATRGTLSSRCIVHLGPPRRVRANRTPNDTLNYCRVALMYG